MKHPGLSSIGIFLFLFLILPGIVCAEGPRITALDLDWEQQVLNFEVTSDIDRARFSPSVRFETEQEILQAVPSLLLDAVSPLYIDSWWTVGGRLDEDPELYYKIENLSEVMERSFSFISENRDSLTIRYTLPLFPYLGELFIHHDTARTLFKEYAFIPTAEFSGILIVATGLLPEVGSDRMRSLQPCLFPRIYDTEGRLVLDRELADPEYISRWGTAGYGDIDSSMQLESRVGTYPLRIVSVGVQGRQGTDVVITSEDASRILATEHNRQLIREGRVLIYFNIPETELVNE